MRSKLHKAPKRRSIARSRKRGGAAIDMSDIAPLNAQFFARAVRNPPLPVNIPSLTGTY